MLRHVFKQLKLHCSPGDAHNYFSYPVIWQGWLLSRDLISIHHRSPCAWVTLKTLLSLTIQLKLKSIVLGFVCLFVYYSILFIFLSIYYYFFYFFFFLGGGWGRSWWLLLFLPSFSSSLLSSCFCWCCCVAADVIAILIVINIIILS